MLQRKFWLCRRRWLEEDKTEWRLKAKSSDEYGELSWKELIGEQEIIEFFKFVFRVPKAKTILTLTYWFPCPVMSHKVVRFYLDKTHDDRVDVCGWNSAPLGAYAVRSYPSTQPTAATPVGAPAKTKVMLFMLNRQAFTTTFSQEDAEDRNLWKHIVMKKESPAEFEVYESILQLEKELRLLESIAEDLLSDDSEVSD